MSLAAENRLSLPAAGPDRERNADTATEVERDIGRTRGIATLPDAVLARVLALAADLVLPAPPSVTCSVLTDAIRSGGHAVVYCVPSCWARLLVATAAARGSVTLAPFATPSLARLSVQGTTPAGIRCIRSLDECIRLRKRESEVLRAMLQAIHQGRLRDWVISAAAPATATAPGSAPGATAHASAGRQAPPLPPSPLQSADRCLQLFGEPVCVAAAFPVAGKTKLSPAITGQRITRKLPFGDARPVPYSWSDFQHDVLKGGARLLPPLELSEVRLL